MKFRDGLAEFEFSIGTGDASRGFTTQHIQLVPKYKVLGLQRCPRLEQPDERGPDQFAEAIHQP
jgi:hypothetical protein